MAHEIPQLKSVHETKDRGYSHVARVDKTLYIAGQVARDVQGKLVFQRRKLRLARSIPT